MCPSRTPGVQADAARQLPGSGVSSCTLDVWYPGVVVERETEHKGSNKMAEHTLIKQMLRKQSGIDHNPDQITIRMWTRWLKGHSDNAIKNLGYGLGFGIKTGRIPNWTRTQDGDFLTRNCKRMTNLQTITMLAKAAIAQGENHNTASALKALQGAMGIITR